MTGKRDFDEYDSEDDHIYSNKRVTGERRGIIYEVDESGWSFFNLI